MLVRLARLLYLSIQKQQELCLNGLNLERLAGWRRGKLPPSRIPTTESLITHIASTQLMETWVPCTWLSHSPPKSRSCGRQSRSDSSTHQNIKLMVNSMPWRCRLCLMTLTPLPSGAHLIKAASPSFSTWVTHRAPSGTGSARTHFRSTWTKYSAKQAVWTLRSLGTWAQRLSLIVWTNFAGTWTCLLGPLRRKHLTN